MSRKHSTTPRKPSKPYDDFPLFPHATRRWAKKIRGKMHYFGPWDEPDKALEKYLNQKDDLHAGRTPRVQGDGLTIKDLCNQFLASKEFLLTAGELAPITFGAYKSICQRMADVLGVSRLVSDLAKDDFEKLRTDMARTWGPVRLGCEIQRVRTVFNWAFEAELLAVPMRFGPGFKKPSKKTLRLHKASGGPCMFDAEEIKRLLAAATVPMRAMILLGINCGFGNADCGTLPMTAVDLDGGWINYPRPKTGVDRRCPLWRETTAALREVLAKRPKPKTDDAAPLVFVTKRGAQWHQVDDRPLSKEMAKLLKKLGINGRRRLGFYALRHTFRTIADEVRDQVAVNHVMGHADESMAAVYRERIGDDRLKAVTDHVRGWLFKKDKKGKLRTGRPE